MGDFNHPDICWKDNTAGHRQASTFLERVEDNFLLQMIEEPTKRGAILDLVLTNKEGLVGNVKVKGSLGCSGHEMMQFKILRAARRVVIDGLPGLIECKTNCLRRLSTEVSRAGKINKEVINWCLSYQTKVRGDSPSL